MRRKISAWLSLCLLLILILPGIPVLGATDIKVDVSTGLDGKTKYGKGAPVTITVENNGPDFSGDIVIDIQQSYSLGSGHAIQFDIGTGETKSINYILPNTEDGYMFGSGMNKRIHLFEGGWKKGKELEYKGSGLLTSSSFQMDAAFIATFTKNSDRLVAIKNLNLKGAETTQVIDASKMDSAKLPIDPVGWEAVDHIIVDEYPLADLDDSVQQALLSWVESGGTLVMGASDNVEAEAGIFGEYLSLKLKETSEINPLTFSEWLQAEGFEDSVPAYQTERQGDANIVLEDEGNAIIAFRKVGKGFVYQTAFSLGDEPIAKSSSMPGLWEKLLSEGRKSFQPGYYQNQGSLETISYTIGQSNELFSSFKVSAPLMFGIIILYIILIIPVLYFILKKKDKREHTWWIIPSIALVTSLAIFGYGAKDRIGQAQVQQSAVLHVEDGGKMKAYFAESILSNKSGDFTFNAPIGTKFTTSLGENFFGNNTTANYKKAIIENDVVNSKIHLRDIGYWNVASLYGELTLDNLGALNVDLTVENKKLVGSITNDYPFSLSDISIWSGADLIPIGNISPGETVQIDEKIASPTLLPISQMNHQSMNPQQTDDLEVMRKEGMINFSSQTMQDVRKPTIIGYTDTQVIPVELEKVNPKMSALTMIVQPIDVNISLNGPLTLETEMFAMSIVSEESNMEAEVMDFQFNEYIFHESKYIQTFELPAELAIMEMNWSELELKNIQREFYSISLLNVQTGLYEKQDAGTVKIIEGVNQYISPEGTLSVRLEFIGSREGTYTTVPELRLKGEAVQ
ncbi:hypothetical protein ACXYMX_01375 [Sporosarcina sp. CAU 1771]